MQFLSAEQVATGLEWQALIRKLDDSFRTGISSPARHHHSIPRAQAEATMLLMPAWEQAGYIGMKMVNVFPQNSALGLPAISGAYLLCDGHTGQMLACIDGLELTRRRTAAASALAAQYLARKDSDTLLIVGSGQLAPMLLEAHSAVRPLRKVMLWARNPDKAAALAEQYRNYPGVLSSLNSIEVVTDLPDAVAQADIISCATLSTEAIIRGEWLQPGTHVDLVGAFRKDMREVDGLAVARAQVYVDTFEGSRGEAGDLHCAIAEGHFNMENIKAELAGLTRKQQPGRQDLRAITLFKSVGASLEDLAAAVQLWEQFNR